MHRPSCFGRTVSARERFVVHRKYKARACIKRTRISVRLPERANLPRSTGPHARRARQRGFFFFRVALSEGSESTSSGSPIS
jgi:hypothetical protein